jgi:DNA-binding SARP family transcriptional activator
VLEAIEAGGADELAALLDGASTLSRAGNHIAAIAALLAAVGIAPDDRTAHRRLAAAYAVAGAADHAQAEYSRFVARLEARGELDTAAMERTYAAAVLAPPAVRLSLAAPSPRHVSHLTREQSFALRRMAVAAVAIAATLGAMFVAGAQIFASGGPL